MSKTPSRRAVSGDAYVKAVDAIAALNKRVAELTAQADELSKKLKAVESSLSYANSRSAKAEGELQQVNALLDAMPNAPARKTTDDYPRDLDTMTRLAAWLAQRHT